MKTHLRVAVGLLATLTLAPLVAAVAPVATSADTTDNAVVHWSGVAETAIAAGRPPASSTVLGGMVHGAMYDAVAAVEGGLEPFVTKVTARREPRRRPPSPRPPATSWSPASRAGRPPCRPRSTPTSPPSRPDRPSRPAPRSAPRRRPACSPRGSATTTTTSCPSSSRRRDRACSSPSRHRTGRHQAARGPALHHVDQSSYRPDAPYQLTGKQYAADVNELQAPAGSTAPSGPPPRRDRALLHRPDLHAVQPCARDLVEAQGLDLVGVGRMLAYVHVSAADTMIACWEAKYHYTFWRPNHAIARADTDGNDATTPDPAGAARDRQPPGVPLRPRLHHGGADRVAASLLRHQARRAHRQQHVVGKARTYDRLDDLVADVEDARVWGGCTTGRRCRRPRRTSRRSPATSGSATSCGPRTDAARLRLDDGRLPSGADRRPPCVCPSSQAAPRRDLGDQPGPTAGTSRRAEMLRFEHAASPALSTPTSWSPTNSGEPES